MLFAYYISWFLFFSLLKLCNRSSFKWRFPPSHIASSWQKKAGEKKSHTKVSMKLLKKFPSVYFIISPLFLRFTSSLKCLCARCKNIAWYCNKNFCNSIGWLKDSFVTSFLRVQDICCSLRYYLRWFFLWDIKSFYFTHIQ